MKFVLKNIPEDGGCKITAEVAEEEDEEFEEESQTGTVDYLVNFYEANERVRWRDVV